MNELLQNLLWNGAIVGCSYAVIRFFDWVVRPWADRRAAEKLRQDLAVDTYIVRPVPDEVVPDVLARIRSAGQ